MIKCLPEFEYLFTVFLKNRNFISKIKRSKVTDYAALIEKNTKQDKRFFCGGFADALLSL